MASLVVLGPSKDERLGDVGSSNHEESGEVEDSRERHWDGHDDYVAYHADYCAENTPAIAMLVVVCQVCANHGERECAGVWPNRQQLSLNRSVPLSSDTIQGEIIPCSSKSWGEITQWSNSWLHKSDT